MKNLWCNYSSPIHKSSCDRRDTDCIKASLIGAPLVGDRAIDISCLTKASLSVKNKHKKHLVCIDPRVENYQHLASGVKPGTEIIVLDRTLDGVEQITEILAKRSLISSLQIVAHGNEASVQLGSTLLNDENLPKYDLHLQQWHKAFRKKADILLLACRVGSGKSGIAFVRKLRQLTGANIAASNNLIGSAKLGGNWKLNVTAGRVKTGIAFETKTQETYSAVLVSLVDESFQDASLIGPWISGVTGTSDAPALTAGTGTDSFPGLNIDPVGSGALRLTSRTFDQSTFVIYNSQVPVNSGLNIVFDIFPYNGTARPNLAGRTGDGISFFLIDGTVTPTQAGGYGGSLGYAQNIDTNQSGLLGGYLGIGLDEFGNFSTETQGRAGGIPGGRRADSVTLRGSEVTQYQFLTSTFVPQGIDNIPDTVNPVPPNGPNNTITTSREAARRRVQIILQPPTSATPNRLTVNFDLNKNGLFTDEGETIIDIANLEDINGPIPATFKFGFAGSTGDATNIHDIRTLSIQTIDVPLTTADVASTKTGPAAAAPGSSITYTITTVNNGPNDSENVVVEDRLPVGAVFSSADGDGTFNETTRLVTWPTIPNLPVGATATRTVTVTTPTTLGPITNSVFSSSSTIDPVPGNNSGSSPDARVTTTITNDIADVVTVKTGPATAVAGSTVTYTITAANSGPSPAANVAIADSIVPGLTGVSVSEGGTYNATTGIVTWPAIASLASAASANRTVSFAVPATGGTVANTASSTSTSPDPNPDNNNGTTPEARVTTTIADSADVVTLKTGPATATPGSTVTYTITAENTGPSTATNITITDSIVPGLTGVTASNGGVYNPATGIVSFPPIASLADGVTVSRTVRFPVPATGAVSNTARSTSTTNDPNPGNNNGSQPGATVATSIAATPTPTPPLPPTPTPTPTPANLRPIANNVNLELPPSSIVAIAGLGGSDPDGSIASFTINTVPPASEGLIFLGNPDTGGTLVTAGQILTPAEIDQLFFQSTANFTTANFTYSATDNQGATSPASATVSAIPLNEPTPTPTPPTPPTPTPTPTPPTPTPTPTPTPPTPTPTPTPIPPTPIPPTPTPTPPTPTPTPPEPTPTPTPTPPEPTPTPTPTPTPPEPKPPTPTPTPTPPTPTPTPPEPTPTPTPPEPTPTPPTPTPAAEPTPIFNPVPEPDTNCGCDPLQQPPLITFIPPQPSPQLNFDSNAAQLTDIQNTRIGTEGNDYLTGNQTNELFLAQGGDDTVLGAAGSDLIFGEPQRDFIAAGGGNDIVYAGIDSDLVFGGKDNDRIFGDRNSDTLYGDRDSDTIVGDNGNNIDLTDNDGDLIFGGSSGDAIAGTQGNDTIYSGKGPDIAYGGTDNDLIWGDKGPDTLSGDNGDDSVFGGLLNSLDSDPDGFDLLTGGEGNDLLHGQEQDDTLVGGNGRDLLFGGKADDRIFGETDSDTLYGNQGSDTIIGDYGTAAGSTIATDEGDLIFGNDGGDLIGGGSGNDSIFAGKGNDLVYGGKDNDLIWGELGADTIIGDQGDDSLYGGLQNELVSDVDGRDLLFGGDGNDFQGGGESSDSLSGGSGNDTLRGGKDDDAVQGDAGDDSIYGDSGSDILCGGEGNDTLFGDRGQNERGAVGSDGQQDCMNGGSGDDLLYGNEGQDTQGGDEGNDTIYGGKDRDILNGGVGDDWLFGDGGDDTLIGGIGNDRFVLSANGGIDSILNFAVGTDKFVLAGGLSFEALQINSTANGTLLQVAETGEVLAQVFGADNPLTSLDFFTLVP
ncbi:DUF4347 domain-containing protein [Microcoleus sp. AT9_B5]